MTKQPPRAVRIACVLVLVAIAGDTASALTATPSPIVTPTTTTAPDCVLAPMPSAGPPGTMVRLQGICGGILYHRIVSIAFDRTLVAQFDGVAHDYDVSFAIPKRAKPGPHTLTFYSQFIEFGRATARFEVTGEPVPCSGDCDGDEHVTIAELIAGVNIAMDRHGLAACPALDGDDNGHVSVDELVVAVDAAVRGCDPPLGCRDSRECEPPAACLPPGGTVVGCDLVWTASAVLCRPVASNCTQDADCGAEDRICDDAPPRYCACASALVCQPACRSEADCKTGETCFADGRCRPAPCAGSESCPAFFLCAPDGQGAGRCERILCDRDSRCGTGVCVNGACYESLGGCAAQIPP